MFERESPCFSWFEKNSEVWIKLHSQCPQRGKKENVINKSICRTAWALCSKQDQSQLLPFHSMNIPCWNTLKQKCPATFNNWSAEQMITSLIVLRGIVCYNSKSDSWHIINRVFGNEILYWTIPFYESPRSSERLLTYYVYYISNALIFLT